MIGSAVDYFKIYLKMEVEIFSIKHFELFLQ